MGLAKSAWMESQERGWDAPDTWICPKCVNDDYLASLIADNAEEVECTYCGRESDTPIASSADALMAAIAAGVFYEYSLPLEVSIHLEDDEGSLQTLSTVEVLNELGLDAHEDFIRDVASGFHNDFWVRKFDHMWSMIRPSQRLKFAWADFVRMVKHQTRFHFLAQKEGAAYDFDHLTPDEILSSIAELLRNFGMLRTVEQDTAMYRCRIKQSHDNWPLDEQHLGAPPSDRASAGRMNPAGISYFYAAFAAGTAIGEIVSHPPITVSIGTFINTEPLIVADLTKLPTTPSIFDEKRHNDREVILFLQEFTRQISQPVKKNGMEHIDYVPSQVVCEYLAQVFEIDDAGTKLDGIVFPSSIKPGCNNIVLFPSHRSSTSKFDKLKFIEGNVMHLDNWPRVIKALEMGTQE